MIAFSQATESQKIKMKVKPEQYESAVSNTFSERQFNEHNIKLTRLAQIIPISTDLRRVLLQSLGWFLFESWSDMG